MLGRWGMGVVPISIWALTDGVHGQVGLLLAFSIPIRRQYSDISVGDLFEKEAPCLQRTWMSVCPPVKQRWPHWPRVKAQPPAVALRALILCQFLQLSCHPSTPALPNWQGGQATAVSGEAWHSPSLLGLLWCGNSWPVLLLLSVWSVFVPSERALLVSLGKYLMSVQAVPPGQPYSLYNIIFLAWNRHPYTPTDFQKEDLRAFYHLLDERHAFKLASFRPL